MSKKAQRHKHKPKKKSSVNYTLLVGTKCHVRKLGEKTWMPYCTKKIVACTDYLWRNETHYGLFFQGYEIKAHMSVVWLSPISAPAPLPKHEYTEARAEKRKKKRSERRAKRREKGQVNAVQGQPLVSHRAMSNEEWLERDRIIKEQREEARQRQEIESLPTIPEEDLDFWKEHLAQEGEELVK